LTGDRGSIYLFFGTELVQPTFFTYRLSFINTPSFSALLEPSGCNSQFDPELGRAFQSLDGRLTR
jgi:hypothetical protein